MEAVPRIMRLGVEFGLEIRIVRTAGAGARGIETGQIGIAELHVAGLGHEAIDDAMEDDAIVKAFAGQLLDVLDVAGRQIRAHGDDHRALGGFDDEGVFGIGVFSHSSFHFAVAR